MAAFIVKHVETTRSKRRRDTPAVGLWLCIKQLERNSYMYLNVTPRGWGGEDIIGDVISFQFNFRLCAWENRCGDTLLSFGKRSHREGGDCFSSRKRALVAK